MCHVSAGRKGSKRRRVRPPSRAHVTTRGESIGVRERGAGAAPDSLPAR